MSPTLWHVLIIDGDGFACVVGLVKVCELQ